MIQTTLEITFSNGNLADVAVETSADGELKLQAELVGFAHLVATVISSLGRERARALVRSLADGGSADDELRLEESSGGTLRIAASFLDARRGPRLFFELKPRDLRRLGEDPDLLAARAVLEVLGALAGERSEDSETAARVRATAALIARAAESGYVRQETTFDVSLAAADLAWGVVGAARRCGSLGFVARRSLSGLWITRARVPALAEPSSRAAVLRDLRSRSLVPRRPSAPICSRCDVERIGAIARRPEGSLEERIERDCVFR